MSAPTSPALRHVREVLRSLSSGRQVYALYPVAHPNRRDSVRVLLEHVRRLQDATPGGVPTLFVTRHSLYLGPALLARESLSLFRLIEALELAGVEAVEFLPHVTEDDLDAFLRFLGDEDVPELHGGGVAVNRVRPQSDELEVVELGELRRAYAQGLETVREMAARAAAGQQVDLEATTRTVAGIADEVSRDPASALLLTTVKSYDEYTYHHMVNVALLTLVLGQAVGLRRDQLLTLGVGALLHDIGKVHVPTDVLQRVGRLTEEQWRLVQRHPVDGAGTLFATSDGLYHPAATVVLEHHAGYDLRGYPSLTQRPTPSVPARLVAVVDCFDAVTSRRTYRAAMGRHEALSVLETGAGRGFDPRVVRVFLSLVGVYPVGSLVELDTGETGLVVRNSDTELGRPTVLVVLDAAGNAVDGEERDLTLRGPDGSHRWHVRRTVDPDRVGIDVVGLLTGGSAELDVTSEDGGLVHEPSPGEAPPVGYVDTHREHHPHPHAQHGDAARPDPDVAPEIGEEDLS